MEITSQIKEYINRSVLCWLATVSKENIPNVSPKEVFTYYKNNIIIANIASPQTLKNIKHNKNVCISFIDILVQKGFQIKGTATIIKKTDIEFSSMSMPLLEITNAKFPFTSITSISIERVKKIVAPKYVLYPETTEKEQIESAKKSYGF